MNPTENQLSHESLLRVMAEASVSFNSAYSISIEVQGVQEKIQEVVLAAPFYPAHFSFGGQVVQNISIWYTERETIEQNGLHLEGVGLYAMSDAIMIAVPETLTAIHQKFQGIFGKPDEVCAGYLNPGGRSFWFFTEDGQAFGLKVHSFYELDHESILTRPLTFPMIRFSSEVSQSLRHNPLFAEEEHGCSMTWGQNSDDPESRYGFLLRRFKLENLGLEAGDVLLPIYCLFSQSFWKAKALLQQLGLPDQENPTENLNWISSQLPEHFARQMESSLFEHGYHLECHQQNLTVHLRQGKVIQTLYHDLQDVLPDPVAQVLMTDLQQSDLEKCLENLAHERDGWAVIGEISNSRNQHKAVFSVHSWWRRWFRILGQYDRISNVLWRQNPFGEEILENRVRNLLIQKASRRLNLEEKKFEGLGLYQVLALIHFEHQQSLLKKQIPVLMKQGKAEAATLDELCVELESQFAVATSRAPRTLSTLHNWVGSEAGASAVLNRIRVSDRWSLFILSRENESHFYIVRNSAN